MENTTCLEPGTPERTTPDPSTPDQNTPARPAPEQLTLLPESSAPTRFRLDAATRRRGLRHVAEMRALLAARRAAREASTTTGRLPASPTGAERPSVRPDRAA